MTLGILISRRAIMRKEGLWKSSPKSVRSLPVQNWRQLLSALKGKTVVVENERTEEFCIGPLVDCDAKAVFVHDFNPSGEWEEVRRLGLRTVTSIHFGDRYSTLYTRHLPPRPKTRTSQGGQLR